MSKGDYDRKGKLLPRAERFAARAKLKEEAEKETKSWFERVTEWFKALRGDDITPVPVVEGKRYPAPAGNTFQKKQRAHTQTYDTLHPRTNTGKAHEY